MAWKWESPKRKENGKTNWDTIDFKIALKTRWGAGGLRFLSVFSVYFVCTPKPENTDKKGAKKWFAHLVFYAILYHYRSNSFPHFRPILNELVRLLHFPILKMETK